jgi:transcriptional regulator with PAS, ATPase and Fis domain
MKREKEKYLNQNHFVKKPGGGELSMRMGEMMTRDVPLLPADSTLKQGVQILRRTKLDGLPVVDAQGNLVGIFTKANLMDAYLAGAKSSESLEKHYNRQVGTIHVDTPYQEIERVVKSSPVGTGVVVDDQGKVLGIFTKVDMIMALFKESEKLAAQLNTIYNKMHNGLIVIDKYSRISLINRSGEKMLGLRQEKIKGCLFGEIIPGIDMASVFKESQIIIGVKQKLNGINTLCNISPIVNEYGVAGAVIIFQALTDLDQVASELEATKRLYETLLTVLNIAYEAIIVVDENEKIFLVNEAACRFLGKQEPHLLNKPVNQVIENIKLSRTLKTGMAETNRIQVIGGRPYIVSCLPIIRAGKVIGAVGRIVFQRLEEVKELAERLAQMDQELSYYKERSGKTANKITFDRIVSVNKEMRRLKQEAEVAARGSSTILLTGESGTGKELFAEAIHNASPRRKGPYVKINCAAVPENLLESEFFGYAPGAFTGAQKKGKPGKFAVADGGTLFLDEIGDMSRHLQSKLLRVLQDQCFEPVGSNVTVKVGVRIIAATNQDLMHKVELGEFRQDLYYRLNVINVKIVPLRYRPEDIIPLVHVFLEEFSKTFGIQIDDISLEARKILLSHHWPGNVRELKNVIERAVNFSTGSTLEVDSLPFYLREQRERGYLQPEPERMYPVQHKVNAIDRETVLQVLHKVNGNKSEAAKVLGISRSWLYEKMRRYNILGADR